MAGNSICGMRWGGGDDVRWRAQRAAVSAGCSLVLGVRWGMSVYTGSHFTAWLWAMIWLACVSLVYTRGFLSADQGICQGACWCASWFCGLSYGCGFWLLWGSPTALDYVSGYLFSFICLGFYQLLLTTGDFLASA